MEENNSDRESFYSADSLENLVGEEKLKQDNFSMKKDCKENVVTVPFYEGEILVPLNCISNMVKSSIKKKLVQNRTLSSNVSRYDNNSLRLNLRSLRAPSETTGGNLSKYRSSSVCPGKNVQGLMPKSSSRSKIIDPSTSVIRPRNRSVSYLEQYRKRLSSSSNRNNLHSSTTTINTSPQNTSIWQDNYFSPTNSLNGSQNNISNNGNLLEKDVEIPVYHENQTQTPVSKTRSSNYIKKHQNKHVGLCQTKAVQSNDFLMKPDQNKQSNDKLASLKKRKEYSEAVKKKNQEELLVQKAQTKVRGRSTEKTIMNNLPFNVKTEKLSPPAINLSSIEKKKEFSDKVKHKNREEFLCQKIQQKTINSRRTKENIIANEDCFTQKIGSTLQLDKPLVKPKFSATHRRKEAIQTKEQNQMKNFKVMTDLEALKIRHEKDKIKANNILNEFLKT